MDLLMVFMLIIILTVFIFFIVLRFKGVKKPSEVVVGSEALKVALITSWKELGIEEDIEVIKSKTEDILHTSKGLQNLFKANKRGKYGEFQLEQILKDILPSQFVHIRESLPIGVPDAYIKTPQGILCIDAKFPLENYRRMLDITDKEEWLNLASGFRFDVKVHIDTIKKKYVKPEEGTMPFALGFIPSEGVYKYLTECEMELLAETAKEGVLLVSPTTIALNLNMLSVGLQASEISERAEQIQRNLGRLSKALSEAVGSSISLIDEETDS